MSESPLPPPRLLDKRRQMALQHFGRPEPAERYVQWALRFILFHNKRHPRELNTGDIGRFLQHVANTEPAPVEALLNVREALTYLYLEVLGLELREIVLPQPPATTGAVAHGTARAALFATDGRMLP